MSTQRSGSTERSGQKRASILQGVYEENVRTRRGEPSPHRRAAGEDDVPAHSWPQRVTAAALAALLVVVGAAWATGDAARAWNRLFPPPVRASGSGAAPVADSVQGRGAPFRPAAGRSGTPSALPLAQGDGNARSVAGLFGLEVQTIVIDPGHGGKKEGAVGPGGTKEKHVALDVARRLAQRLRARPGGYRVLLTRTGDRHRSLRERVQFANSHQTDLFVSLHVNALPDTNVRSVETYYYGRQASEEERRLARRENQSSGYSVAAFNQLLEETGRRLRRQESKRLAGSIQKSLFRNMKARTPDLRDWGVRTAPFVVLLGVEAPSVLAEIGVLSNPDEEQQLRRPAYRASLARFLERGVARYLGTAAATAPPATPGAGPLAGALPPDTALTPVPRVLP
jgi:N-acetylmuramoyl-L-alanine amidase